MDLIDGNSPCKRHFDAHLSRILRSAALDRQQMIENGEVRGRKSLPMTPHALIDGLQIKQHGERPWQ